MSAGLRNLLGIGLSRAQTNMPLPSILVDEIAKARAASFNLEFFEVDTSQSQDAILASLEAHLKSKPFSAISVGFGVRGDRELTPLFEKLINTCVQVQPSARFGFALMPNAVLETCQRVLQQTGK